MPGKTGWEIGFSKKRVTPPLGGQMAGFDARKGVSNAVHDELHARAMVFDDGTAQVAMVSVEVIAVGAEFAAGVRARVEAETGIPAGSVFLSATHTHCGPVTINHFFNQGQPLDVGYLAALGDGIVAAVREAWEGKKRRVLRSGLVACDGIAVNRRAADGLPVDPYAGVLAVEEMEGALAAVAVFYACHTTVLGPDTLSITQDFPFYTHERLKEVLGVETMFFNGAEGDLSIGHKSDLSAVGIVDSFRTFPTAKRLGEKLAEAVIAGLPGLTEERALIAVATEAVRLPLKRYEAVEVMTAKRERALAEIVQGATDLDALKKRQAYLFARIEEYYAKLWEAAEGEEEKTLAVEFSAIRLGDTVMLTLPGEVFVRIALGMREASRFAKTFFLGLTNDYIGYVPDEQATAASGYEVVASRVPALAGGLLQEAAVRLLDGLEREGSIA